MLDLQSFCATNPYSRSYLLEPFSKGEFTYATDGCILIRQARRDDAPAVESNAPGHCDEILNGRGNAEFCVPQFNLPPAPQIDVCPFCEGRGRLHDCPRCECECDYCDEAGEINPERTISTEIKGVPFGLKYVRLLVSLPGLEIAEPSARGPLLFRFAGGVADDGVGALMPRSVPAEKHIKIENT